MGGALVTQQLAEFLAAVSAHRDPLSATHAAVERAARAVEAEVAAVVGEHGVVSAVGFAAGRVPVAELADVVAGRPGDLAVPGAGPCRTAVAAIGGSEPRHLVLARSGADGLTVDEMSLIRGMARVLEPTVETLYTLDAERRQAAENARLLASLQERQRLLEQLSTIQRAIARRAPLQQILDSITGRAQELLGDEAVGLRLRDGEDPEVLLLVSSCGLPEDSAQVMWRGPVARAGGGGQAQVRGNLVAARGHEGAPSL